MNIKAEQKQKVTLPSPLFRDPIYDCPTDPTVIWNEKEEQWYLLYTQRRATDVPIGVSWVHGTALGVATSRDGTKWLYRGTLEGLDIEPGHNTFWAPEIIEAEGLYHMYVSYITGIPNDWEYPRWMLHYTSTNSSVCFYFKSFTLFWVWNIFICFCQFFSTYGNVPQVRVQARTSNR